MSEARRFGVADVVGELDDAQGLVEVVRREPRAELVDRRAVLTA